MRTPSPDRNRFTNPRPAFESSNATEKEAHVNMMRRSKCRCFGHLLCCASAGSTRPPHSRTRVSTGSPSEPVPSTISCVVKANSSPLGPARRLRAAMRGFFTAPRNARRRYRRQDGRRGGAAGGRAGFAFRRGWDRLLEYPIQMYAVPGVNHQGRRRRQTLDNLVMRGQSRRGKHQRQSAPALVEAVARR